MCDVIWEWPLSLDIECFLKFNVFLFKKLTIFDDLKYVVIDLWWYDFVLPLFGGFLLTLVKINLGMQDFLVLQRFQLFFVVAKKWKVFIRLIFDKKNSENIFSFLRRNEKNLRCYEEIFQRKKKFGRIDSRTIFFWEFRNKLKCTFWHMVFQKYSSYSYWGNSNFLLHKALFK